MDQLPGLKLPGLKLIQVLRDARATGLGPGAACVVGLDFFGERSWVYVERAARAGANGWLAHHLRFDGSQELPLVDEFRPVDSDVASLFDETCSRSLDAAVSLDLCPLLHSDEFVMAARFGPSGWLYGATTLRPERHAATRLAQAAELLATYVSAPARSRPSLLVRLRAVLAGGTP